MKQVIHLLPQQPYVCMVVKKAFAPELCKKIIEERKNNFAKAITHYPTSYRNNDRQVVDDDTLAALLFEEIKQYVPSSIDIAGVGKDEAGNWQLKELNHRLRICRYQPEQYFNKHLDGVHYQSATVQSKLTFMVYLNDSHEFIGGRTLFFASKDSDEVIQEFLPETGDLIIFDHNIWHAGEVLHSGIKYILRSDILYQKTSPVSSSTDQPFAEGHLGYIWAIAHNPHYVFTGGRDKLLKVWSKDGEALTSVQAHANSVVAILPYGNDLVITASRDQTVRGWQLDDTTGKLLLRPLWQVWAHEATILNLCKIDDQRFASLGADGMVQMITTKGELKKNWLAHHEWIWAMVKMNDACVLTGSEDGSLKWWDYQKRALLGEWAHSRVPVTALVFDAPNQWLFVGRNNGTIECLQWDNQTLKLTPLHSIYAHQGIIRCLKIHQHLLVSGAEDNLVKLWQLTKLVEANLGFEPLKTYAHNNFVQDVLLLDQQLVSVSYDGKIAVNAY
ncbi:2OG-Fe(II) oxygenase [Microscilla marina]|nr:2OG-Fe(II) oxygenase [Microscilla marina]